MKKMLKAALKYADMGYSVIPVNPNKKSCVKWEQFQHKAADTEQIKTWWKDFPNANVAVITGKVSGVTVVDADSATGVATITDMMPESMITPISYTPRNNGQHFWFRHYPGIENKVRALTDCDVRNDGGYVVVPPSKNGNGEYSWMPGLRITDIALSEMPETIAEILLQFSSKTALKNGYIPLVYDETAVSSVSSVSQVVSSGELNLSEGHRDDALFTLANSLVRGGMPPETIRKYLVFFAAHCSPPFPQKDAEIKIKSAIQRKDRSNTTLVEEIKKYVQETSRDIIVTELRQVLGLRDSRDKLNANRIMSRLCDAGVVKRVGKKSGVYRKIEPDCEPEDWQSAEEPTADIWLPWDLTYYAKIPCGGLILMAGEPNAGKTAASMNIARENMRKWDVHYYSSEISAAMFKKRAMRFPNLTYDQWDVKFYSNVTDYADAIKRKAKKNVLFIIDYLEIYDSFWQVGQLLADIHAALGEAVCVCNIQKSRGKDLGLGGDFTQFKPSLSLAIRPNCTKVMKLKEWDDTKKNINHMEYHWKLVDGCQYIRTQGGWKITGDTE